MSDDESPVPSRVLTIPDALTSPTQDAGTDPREADEGETQSPAMRELFVKAQRVARTELTILVTGETGVGKEWLASCALAAGRAEVCAGQLRRHPGHAA